MDADQIGIFLEDQGFSDEAIDEYFEHHGVAGQKWGVRNTSRSSVKNARLVNRGSGHQALKLTAGTVAGALIGKGLGKSTTSIVVGAVIGRAVTKKLLDRHGQRKASEIKDARKVLFGG